MRTGGDRGHLCWVAETPDEAASTVRFSPSLAYFYPVVDNPIYWWGV